MIVFSQTVTPARNHLLALLPLADLALLRPHLEKVRLVPGSLLARQDHPSGYVVFPHSGLVSLALQLRSGMEVEVEAVGCDGMIGASAAVAGLPSFTRAKVQIAGYASRITLHAFREAFNESAALQSLVLRYNDYSSAVAQQSAVCNVQHAVTARLARALLRARELVGDDLSLTQDFISHMLGVRRTTVTIAARFLQTGGLIKYCRGQIRIVDLGGLRQASCECYEAIRKRHELLFPCADQHPCPDPAAIDEAFKSGLRPLAI